MNSECKGPEVGALRMFEDSAPRIGWRLVLREWRRLESGVNGEGAHLISSGRNGPCLASSAAQSERGGQNLSFFKVYHVVKREGGREVRETERVELV